MKQPRPLTKVVPLAAALGKEMERYFFCKRLQIVGSIRRGCDVVGDIDMVIEPTNWKRLLEWVPKIQNFVLTTGTNNAGFSGLYHEIQVNVIKATEEFWGASILFLTGSAFFNIVMRGIAKKQGYKLNQYGLFHGEHIIAGKTEEQIFEALGLEWVDPVDRSINKNDSRAYHVLRRKEN